MNKKIYLIIGCLIIATAVFLNCGVFVSKANYSSFQTGQKLVVAKGTPVRLATTTIPMGVNIIIKAKTTNTGKITLAADAVTAVNSGAGYFSLYPGESVELNLTQMNLIWFDGETGEGVEYILETQ